MLRRLLTAGFDFSHSLLKFSVYSNERVLHQMFITADNSSIGPAENSRPLLARIPLLLARECTQVLENPTSIQHCTRQQQCTRETLLLLAVNTLLGKPLKMTFVDTRRQLHDTTPVTPSMFRYAVTRIDDPYLIFEIRRQV